MWPSLYRVNMARCMFLELPFGKGASKKIPASLLTEIALQLRWPPTAASPGAHGWQATQRNKRLALKHRTGLCCNPCFPEHASGACVGARTRAQFAAVHVTLRGPRAEMHKRYGGGSPGSIMYLRCCAPKRTRNHGIKRTTCALRAPRAADTFFD
jgi:hypothetical protein